MIEKECTKCGKTKPLDDFFNSAKGKYKKTSKCKVCGAKASKEWFANNRDKEREYSNRKYRRNLKTNLICSARKRARQKGLEFRLTQDDIEIPEFCPILGCKLQVGDGKQHWLSPTLDRLDPTKGYTPENVWIISHRANTMKSNATCDDLLKFKDWIIKTYG